MANQRRIRGPGWLMRGVGSRLGSLWGECCRLGLLLTVVRWAGTLTLVAERGEHARAGGGSRRIRGRDTELSVLAQRIADARAGTGGVVVAEGPPGIGKSRLLAEAISLATTAGLRVARGEADEADQVAPLSCLLGALHSGFPPLLSAQRLLALDPRPDQRYWLLQELEALLEEAALREPLLLVIDDVQWADPNRRDTD